MDIHTFTAIAHWGKVVWCFMKNMFAVFHFKRDILGFSGLDNSLTLSDMGGKFPWPAWGGRL